MKKIESKWKEINEKNNGNKIEKWRKKIRKKWELKEMRIKRERQEKNSYL